MKWKVAIFLFLLFIFCTAEVLYVPVLINNFNGNQHPATNFLSLSASNIYIIRWGTNISIFQLQTQSFTFSAITQALGYLPATNIITHNIRLE